MENTNLDDITNNSQQRPRSASVQSSRSWPLLPVLQVTTTGSSSNDAHLNNRQTEVINEPIMEADSKNASSNSTTSDSETSSEYEDILEQDLPRRHSCTRQLTGKKSTTGSKKSDSAGTLVEAALEQPQARERHVRFGDHILEAGHLVERMLSTRIEDDVEPPSHNYHTHTIDEDSIYLRNGSIEDGRSPSSPTAATGSVLASLMKLESQRKQAILTKQKSVKRKKVNKESFNIFMLRAFFLVKKGPKEQNAEAKIHVQPAAQL